MSRFFMISNEGDGLGIALRLKDEGHDVTVKIRDKRAAKDYNGLLKKADKIIAEPGTTFIFDSTGGGKTADRLRGQNFAVIGASMFADQLELDRAMGLGLMEEAGIKVPPSEHFTDWNAAIAYAEQRDKRLAIKSDNDLPSYVSSCAEDMVEFLKFHQAEGERADFDLQDFVKGLEISTEGWFDGNAFSRPFNHTFERKQLMNDDLGPSGGCAGNVTWACQHAMCKIVEEGLAQFEGILRNQRFVGMIDLNTIVNDEGVWGLEWCYSSDTEVLTHTGWKLMADVIPGEIVCGLNDDGELVPVPVRETTRLRWDKPLIHVKSDYAYDLQVTPHHNMVYQNADGTLYHKPACDTAAHGERTKRTAKWVGLDLPTYTIPEYVEQHALGRHRKTVPIVHSALTFKMEDWCRFLGLFVAEGHLQGKGGPYQAVITQTTKIDACAAIIDKLSFNCKHDDNKSFRISSIQLGSHLRKLFGDAKASAKRMPRFILDLAPRYIEAFLDGFTVGDGSIHKRTKQRSFHSSSRGLIDDIGECLLRVGRWGRVHMVEPSANTYGDGPMFTIGEHTTKLDGRVFPKRHFKEVPYSGYVVCLNVEHHRLYVRRNGGPAMWCANTPRFGYDAFPALMEMFTEGLGETLVNYARGNPMPKFPMKDKGFGAAVRVTIPPYPSDFPAPEGMAIGGLVRADRPHAYFYNVMLDKDATLRSSGGWGTIAAFTGCGEDIRSALRLPYEIAHRAQISDKQMRTDLCEVFEKSYYEYSEVNAPSQPAAAKPDILLASR